MAERRRQRAGVLVERQHPAVAVERDHRIGQAGDHGAQRIVGARGDGDRRRQAIVLVAGAQRQQRRRRDDGETCERIDGGKHFGQRQHGEYDCRRDDDEPNAARSPSDRRRPIFGQAHWRRLFGADAARGAAEQQFANSQNHERDHERNNVIEQPEQQQAGQQIFLVELPERHHHRGVEHAEAAGRVAGEAEQCGGDEDHRHCDEAEIGLVGHQHVHRRRAAAEIDDADRDLQQRQRPARQRHLPAVAADDARLDPDPGHIGAEHGEHHERQHPVAPQRQLIDGARGLRRIQHAEPEHGGIAEPERQPGEEADLGDLDDAQAPGGIDAIAHGAAGEHAGADIVADRVAGEAGQRRDPVRDFGAPDRAQREQVVEGQRQIAGGDEGAGDDQGAPVGRLDGVEQRVGIDVAQDAVEHDDGDDDDGEAERNTQAAPADAPVEKMRGVAQALQHFRTGCWRINRPFFAPRPPLADVVCRREGGERRVDWPHPAMFPRSLLLSRPSMRRRAIVHKHRRQAHIS